jgi:predicted DNA-binding transcriptional regulator YafY
MQELFQPLFTQATQTLNALGQHNQLQHWLNCVVVESPTQPMLAPVVLPVIQNAVYEAVYEQKQLEVSYQAHGKTESKTMILHPLGIIQRGQVAFMISLKAK